MFTQLSTDPAAPSTNAESTQRKKILIVEDEEDARELFVEILGSNPNYEIHTADDGTTALEAAEKEKYDLILLDIVMPKMDGIEALRKLKADPAKYGESVIIMLTNIGGDLAVEKALEMGANDYRIKIETEPEDLIKFVEQSLMLKPLKVGTDGKAIK